MNNILEFLRQKKLKKSSLRIALLEVFSQSTSPITIDELENLLKKKNIFKNKTSLYRQIEVLTEKNIIQPIILKNSIAHYELQNHHHHHFICEKCEKIECFDNNDLETHVHALEKKLTEQGMHISSHQFSFHGTCKQCTF